MEKRLKGNAELNGQYTDFMDEYLRLGHMRPISASLNIPPGAFYLPHHAVIKSSSTSTKLRVVFDASAKSTNGVSLNSTLHVGPTIQSDIFAILLRWRKYNTVITGIVEKMYRQIWVAEPHQMHQRILWRNNKNELQDFELTTITYGTASAPFLAVRKLNQLAQDEKNNYPIAAQKTVDDMYVDDFISGGDSVNDVLILHKEMTTMFSSAGFNLRKWASNSTEVLNSIPIADQESTTSLDINRTEIMKTLGMYWNTERDIFQFKIDMSSNQKVLSKRSLLSSDIQLHGFCDASNMAYAAVVYCASLKME